MESLNEMGQTASSHILCKRLSDQGFSRDLSQKHKERTICFFNILLVKKYSYNFLLLRIKWINLYNCA